MDKNSVIGLVLIIAIMAGWFFATKPSAELLAKQKRMRDSVALVQQQAEEKIIATQKQDSLKNYHPSADTSTVALSDSAKQIMKSSAFGTFSNAAEGENKEITIENDLMKVNISAKGGRISSVELKNYVTGNKEPLKLFTADSSKMAIEFGAYSKGFSTDSLFFGVEGKPFVVAGTDSSSISMRLKTNDPTKYLEFVYSLKGNSNLVGFKINLVGLNDIISSNQTYVTLQWNMNTPTQEKDIENERKAATLYYKYSDDEVDNITAGKDEEKKFETSVKWLAYRQQFFTSVLIADNAFASPSDAKVATPTGSADYVKQFSSSLSIPYSHQATESFGMKFYFGPTHYYTLKSYNLDLEKQLYLGWNVFSYVNKWLIIPIFDFLSGFNMNYGIIILLLTIIIKVILYPIAYKTYLSSAKMRVLKPEIDEINKKFGTDDPMKKQQATMALYKKAGVNPLAGCIPVLLQMPILMALFSFFPASFELRQQSFLWATDLSTYDSILDFAFNIPFYGNHVSLFTLLMTVSTLLYTYSNSQLMGNTEQMPGMKVMMYLMPVIFLGVFNNYSAGLSYYYFLANMITFGQTWFMRKFVDEKALHAKIEENKKKPVKVSSFQKRLEDMAKQRQQQVKRK